MRQAAADAEVGDDVYRDDPTVNELEGRAAELVGMESALYVPSGTMGNQVAVRTHTERGQELLCDEQSHIYKWELGGIAQLSSLQARTVNAGDRGVPSPQQIESGHVTEDLHRPGTGLVTLENTHNSRGGIAVQKSDIDAAAETAHDFGVPVHLDGARVFNACVALDTEPEAMVEKVDSVMFCLSKGLGAPVGSILAGSEGFIEEARRTRKLFGGGMRQAGMIAAPGLLALDNIEALGTDHENATLLAEGLNAIPGLSASIPDTNIVMVDTHDAGLTGEELSAACKDRDVAFHAVDEYQCRLCTHLDVDRQDVESAISRIELAAEAVAPSA